MPKILLEAGSVELSFGPRTILEIKELKIYDGDRIGLIGENGAGKTTLLRVLSGEREPDAEFPAPLRLESNVEYVRGVLGGTAHNTAVREDYADVRQLASLDTFADYQHQVNEPLENVVSHTFIQKYIRARGQDYRFETAPNPVEALRDRTRDNVCVGRAPLCGDCE